ncbi:type IV pili methyl-accepting chemotaxis transducer N-terminal domain-containing protein [Sulfurovum sp. NBC37-1]|uniref:type IV pili methyl-accepting chemotaxis transducer N-terminal domain-containing protein n=1 Tax=Sulfurovum sp. (strain NBC37-1) TaxID=387093 RepID=UPI0002D2FB95|nr:type IV pili methyl-accepting chemotaxis transducer N-terminal domain-containing protein [Sulfurovum sp. NBC37-1]
MKNVWIKNISMAAAAVLVFSGNVYAVQTTEAPAATTKKTAIADVVQLIDIAGKQRMLSQRIAKDYLYVGKKIAVSKASKQQKKSIEEMIAAHKVLVDSINDPEIQNLLSFVELSIEDFKTTANEPFNLDNAQLIIDLSESMLEGSQYVVNSLKEKVKVKESAIVGKSGKQRMLAQRIAKYYIAYQAGIKDKNTVDQMKAAVAEFSEAHKALMKNQANTPEINRKLHEVDRLWKIVYKFYLNIEKGGLPLIVFNTTDDITKKMNTITAMYVELYK